MEPKTSGLGLAGRLGHQMTAVAVDAAAGTDFRLPSELELTFCSRLRLRSKQHLVKPFGLPTEPLPGKDALGIRVPLYGLDKWNKLFTGRALVALASLVSQSRLGIGEMTKSTADPLWTEAVTNYLALGLGRAANYMSTRCLWDSAAGEVKQTFLRFALPITWDFAEANPLSGADRYYSGGISKIGRVLDSLVPALDNSLTPRVHCASAITFSAEPQDLVITDPPYYDAIPYSDLMDFFYVWMRRMCLGLDPRIDEVLLNSTLAPKWNHESQDGELIDDASRFENDASRSTEN